MDVISHGLWGGLALGREKKNLFLLSFLFGVFPDVFAFFIVFFQRLFLGFITTGPMLDIPEYVHQLYNISHSLVISGIILSITLFIWGKKALVVAAWPLHILFDIPTHDVGSFPTPFLWPAKTPFFPGIPWNTPWVFFMNWACIIMLYTAWYFVEKKDIKSIKDKKMY